MLYENLSYKNEDHILLIRLHKVTAYQTRTEELSNELSDLCTTVTQNKEIHVVIINWEPEAPSSGMDLGEDVLTRWEGRTKPWSLAAPVAKLDIPIITAMNGYTIGQDLELALACDIRIASDTSHFGLPHVREGLIPWDGGTQRLSRLIGRAKAIEIILTGEIIDAREAHRIGLVHKVVENSELMNVVMNMAQEIASKMLENPPLTVGLSKIAIYRGIETTSLAEHQDFEIYNNAMLSNTLDFKEGLNAFLEKRKPQFQGK